MSDSYDKTALRKQRTDLWVGLFVFMGLAIMGALVVQFGRFSDRLRETYYVHVTYQDAGGIVRGSPVKLSGAKVGVVSDDPKLNLKYSGVTVLLEIHSDKKIPAGSSFSIASSGLMGDSYIRILGPKELTGEYIKPDAKIVGDAAGGLDKLRETAGELSDQAKLVMEDVRAAVADVRKAVQSLNRAANKIENGLLSDENVANFKDTLADLKKTGENFKAASTKLEPLFDSGKEAIDEAKSAFTKAGETFDMATAVIKKAEPAMEKLDPAVTELKETLAKINAAIDKITEGPGTTAALISDKELKKNLESFISNLNKHGILRYKNDSEIEQADSKKPTTGASRSSSRKWFFKKR